ncbi:WD40 repeat 2 [Sarocladium implicatum]|nr:WD40 repeat 2 [Sarocladium implicatum]
MSIISETRRAVLLERLRTDLSEALWEPAPVSDKVCSWFLDWLCDCEREPHDQDLYYAFLRNGMEETDMWKKTMNYYKLTKSVPNWLAEIRASRMEDLKSASGSDSLPQLPGLGLSLGHMPEWGQKFRTLDEWAAATLLNREVCMLSVLEKLTNKPDWWVKCRDDEVAERWKSEMLQMDWPAVLGLEHADFTASMADAVIAELRQKADLYDKTGLIPVMDYSAAAIKSDKILTQDLTQALQEAIAPLENVPEDQKDWHPGSDDQVLDIVHPSLWPLVYGKTRVVVDKSVSVADALDSCGTGFVIPQPSKGEKATEAQSTQFQWLPCNVSISSEGKAKVKSYINNVHPVQHAKLYPVIEQFIEKSLPAWDLVYRWPEEFECQRLQSLNVRRSECHSKICTEAGKCNQQRGGTGRGRPSIPEAEFEEGLRVGSEDWLERTHLPKNPEPAPGRDFPPVAASHVRSSGFFDSASEVQVIVKLANIHLTPEKPKYEGGSWHVEGMLNEHIVSTALYYYDSENITDSHLDFRTTADAEDLMMDLNYEQSDFDAIERIFAIDARGSSVQNIGGVLTRQGRALFFPNVFQHCVSPFQLADRTRPGHRKILALFLVDPKIPIISTANVPPQQKHWWTDETQLLAGGDGVKLPPELRQQVVGDMDWPMGLDEAKEVRKELMKERSMASVEQNRELERREYNFCEH